MYWLRKNKYLLLLLFLLGLITTVLYKDYLFGERLFLFRDIGSDTIRASLPTYYLLFDWLKSGMYLWSDKIGIGTSVLSRSEVILDPFTYILFIFGKNNIIYMFGFMAVTKIILSGVFFWLFIGKFSKNKFSNFSRIIGSLIYAFSGYMIVDSQIFHFGTIYVYMPLIFLCFEIWIQDKKKWLLILMLITTALYYYYFFYMMVIFLAIYALCRYFSFYKFDKKSFREYILTLSSIGLLALGLSAFYWLPSLIVTLSNLRVGGSVLETSNLFFQYKRAIVTMVTRIFGNDTLGNQFEYVGYRRDYLQLALYSGVITLVLGSQLLSDKDKRRRKMNILLTLSLVILLTVPFFSYLFNGFSDFTYRWTFVISFSLAIFISTAINCVFEDRKINYRVLYITAGILLLIPGASSLFISILNPDGRVSISNFHFASPFFLKFTKNLSSFIPDYFLITAYVAIVLAFFKTKFKKILKIILLILVVSELIFFSRPFVQDRITLSPDPIKNHYMFFDHTIDALSFIKKIDSSVFRVDKSYDSLTFGITGSNNDSMMQDFRGLKSYYNNNETGYIRFLQKMGIYVKYPPYIPPKETVPEDIGGANLNYINGVGNRYLLQTFLGVKYYLVRDNQKIKPPLYYKYLTTTHGIEVYKNENFLPLSYSFNQYLTSNQFEKLGNDKKDIAILSSVVLGSDDNFIKKSHDLNFEEKEIGDLIKDKRENSLKITSYSPDKISGSINAEENEILLFTIPYNLGWSATLDEKRVPLVKVDYGLIGIKVPKGRHEVKLQYFPEGMKTGITITLITLLIVLIYYRRNMLFYMLKHKS